METLRKVINLKEGLKLTCGAESGRRVEGDRPYVTQAVNSSGVESAVSGRTDGVSQRREVVLRDYRAARHGAGGREPLARSSGHEHNLSGVVRPDAVVIGAEGRERLRRS